MKRHLTIYVRYVFKSGINLPIIPPILVSYAIKYSIGEQNGGIPPLSLIFLKFLLQPRSGIEIHISSKDFDSNTSELKFLIPIQFI